MKQLALIALSIFVLSSCAMFQKPKTLEEVRSNLACIEYTDGMEWGKILERLGAVDIAPLPEPGSNLQGNTRVYTNNLVIFFVENKEFEQNGKTRFHEVANKIEICKKK